MAIITQQTVPSQPTYTLTVNGVDYSSRLEDSSWSVNQQWSRQGATATFNITDDYSNPNGGPDLTPLSFPPMARIVLTDTAINQVLFSGMITSPTMNWISPNVNYWNLNCSDWTYLTDHSIVAGDFVTQNAEQVVLSLLTQANIGLGTDFVMSGPQIPRIQFNFLTLSQALTKICQYSSMNAMYGWFVDENQNLWFSNQDQMPSPTVTASDSPSDFVNYDPTKMCPYQSSWQFLWDGTNVQNMVYVVGATYVTTVTDAWSASPSVTVYPLTQTPDSSTFNNTATLTIGGTPYTVSVLTGQNSTASTQFVVEANAQLGWSLQTGTTTTFPSGTMVLTYPYLQPSVSVALNAQSISEFSGLPNHGKFQSYISNSTAVGLASAQNIALTQLNSYGLPQERFIFRSGDNFTGHIKAGSLIKVKNKFAPNSLAGYTPGINNENFLVIQSQFGGTFTGYRSYNVTAVRTATGSI